MKIYLYIISLLTTIFGSFWLFNHVNSWLGIAAILIMAGVVLLIIKDEFKNK
jgi:drug/metabolite transporter (DMT)-like permease